MELLATYVEALIFCAEEPVTVKVLGRCLSDKFGAEIPEEDIIKAISALEEKYDKGDFAFFINKSSGGYQFLTKPVYQSLVTLLLQQKAKKKLSTSAMETLSIIAYKQPITKMQMEQIRGVSCDYAVQKLLEKGLIEIKGKSESLGRPLLYGTTEQFMEYFGINHLKELPTPTDFRKEDNIIGEMGED
ncbi:MULTISPECIES: SMC-Scp complex subunit ScpB [Persicobacter]|uniref:SMC-Scp complex subunit ScpB n=1 Tax=Persicobacter diffluens TaxID=981 RepID=A0AAN4VY25_9BACT|nr:SMC-Scp complex subunit ScpB [Persicobacter sp. CCB-QB2]GJM62136.1 hypothetical protein PEDI_26880 [Persicobacter diffluens]